MRIEYLRYILAIAETHSMNAAAHKLFISQQGLSEAIKRVETQWQITLFNRSKVGVSFTPAGQELLPIIKSVVQQYDLLEETLFNVKASENTTSQLSIKLLANSLPLYGFIFDLIAHLKHTAPQIQITYQEVDLPVIALIMSQGNADCAVFRLQNDELPSFSASVDPDLSLYKLFDDEIYLSIASTHPLAKQAYIPQKYTLMYPCVKYSSPYDVELLTGHSLFQNNTMIYTSKLLADKFFPQPEIVSLPIKPSQKFAYYLLIPQKTLLRNSEFLQALQQISLTISNHPTDLKQPI